MGFSLTSKILAGIGWLILSLALALITAVIFDHVTFTEFWSKIIHYLTLLCATSLLSGAITVLYFYLFFLWRKSRRFSPLYDSISNLIKEIIKSFIDNSELKEIRVFTIICGLCRELSELISQLTTDKSIIFTCLDENDEPLRLSKNSIKNHSQQTISFNFIKLIVQRFIPVTFFFADQGHCVFT